MTIQHTNAATHSRHFVFRHRTITDEKESSVMIEYLMDNCYWSKAFHQARLTDGIKALELATQASRMLGGSDGFTYCVGKVTVDIDGHYEAVVVNG